MTDWRVWLKGLASAVIGGASTAVTLVIVDPMTFNLETGLSKLGTVVVVNAIVSAALYLKASPLP